MTYGVKLDPTPIVPGLSIKQLVDNHFYSYNAGRMREACQLFARKIAQPDVTIGITLTGALTPTGLGTAAIVPEPLPYINVPPVITKLTDGVIVPPYNVKVPAETVKVVQLSAPILISEPPANVNVLEQVNVQLVYKSNVPVVNVHVVQVTVPLGVI